ncbi:hypothetical protein [Niallia alba]|uniref:Uncharacterized protein n=1 Tax=Niallia alba TaxID=2729105 RepID=A0A7Y0PM91_9BACI|nr:hypothetical protein [Niallia alba]NMO76219.1 hypothetical protein [Niallia alba]
MISAKIAGNQPKQPEYQPKQLEISQSSRNISQKSWISAKAGVSVKIAKANVIINQPAKQYGLLTF